MLSHSDCGVVVAVVMLGILDGLSRNSYGV
jgi:hypothetical protein